MEDFATMEIDIPLVSTSAIKVAVFLWYHEDANQIMDLKEDILEQVMRNVEALPLPKYLQRKVLNVVQYVGFHLRTVLISLNCMITPLQSTQSRWPIKLNFPKLLCWKNIGTVDKRKTAEKILNCGVLDTVDAFRLACFNCVENEIFKLWCDSTARIERNFVHLLDQESKEMTFWLSYLRKTVVKLMRKYGYSQNETARYTTNEFGFSFAVANQNVVFADYHARKVEDSRRNQLMLYAVEKLLDQHFRDFHPDIFQLVFSHLDREQKIKIFGKNPLFTLPHLLSWPLQDFFLDVAQEVYDCLFPLDFMAILSYIYLSILKYKKHFEVLEYILTKFWENSGIEHRAFVLSKWMLGKLTLVVFSSRQFEIRLGESDMEQKFLASIITNGCMFFEVLAGHCYLDSLENVVKKYMSTEPLVVEFQNVIRDLRSDHSCESLCYPNCFEGLLSVFPDSIQLSHFWFLCN